MCPVCDASRVPSDDQWWMDNKTHRCPNCFSEIGLSGWQRFRLYGWDSIVGWLIGVSVLTLGLALVITLPVYIVVRLGFAYANPFAVLRRNGVD